MTDPVLADQDGPDWRASLLAAGPPGLAAGCLRLVLGLASPWLALLAFLVPGLAGCLAVIRYRQRYGEISSGWQACAVGALAGLLCFLPSCLLQLTVLATQGAEAILGPMRDQAGWVSMPAETVGLLEDPVVFAIVVTFGLLFDAVVSVGLAAVGGTAYRGWRQGGWHGPER